MAKEINFSDRTVPQPDPHSWSQRQADVILDGRTLYQVPVYICERCGAWSPISPRFIRYENMSDCRLPTIGDLNLSTRAISCISTLTDCATPKDIPVSELTKYSVDDLLKTKNLGKGTLREVELALRKYGYQLKGRG